MAATAVRLLARGVVHRRGSSLAILLVALVASAAAAIGPAYYASAQTSILRDTLAAASASSRGIELSDQTGLDGALTRLSAQTQPVFDELLPAAVRSRVFQPPIEATEATAVLHDGSSSAPLVWRTDVCAHLRFRSGHCSTKPGQVIVSPSFATTMDMPLGRTFVSPGWGSLTVVGIYDVPDATKPYWFGRGGTYFSNEEASSNGSASGPGADAMFTPRATITDGTGQPQGTVIIDRLVNTDAVRSGDLPYLVHAATELGTRFTGSSGALILTDLPDLAATVHTSWRTLEISIVLITVQLLVLVWLVMYTIIGDAIAARGPEIALMKLRGRRRLRLLTFALGEPVALLAVALPLGVGIGAVVAGWLDAGLLRDGTPAALPWTTWAAAGVATLGGVAATLVSARRTLRRSVVDQWGHADREAARRGWVLDTLVLTAAVAAVVELVVGGHVTSVQKGSLGLLVPGLLGLAVAVVASRLLPWTCRRVFGLTRRRGGLGAFLAVRQIARRSAGARTTVVLATAFALATFALAAWATGQQNRQLVADVQVGAPTVLTVAPATSSGLEQVVDKIDPGGTHAALVDYYFPGTGSPALLAVDPARFSHVAAWRGDFAAAPLSDLMRRLAPPVAKSVDLTGDRIRVRLDAEGLKPAGAILGATLRIPGSDGPVNVELGSIPRTTGPVTLTARLPGCPCTLASLDLSAPVTRQSGTGTRFTGALLLTGIDTRASSGWTPVTGLNAPARWRQVTDGLPDPESSLSRSGSSLRWPVDFSSFSVSSLAVADVPAQLLAVVSSQLGAGAGATALGLGGDNLTIDAFANASAIPGAPGGGVIVDRIYAERNAADALSALVDRQVWVAAGAEHQVEAGLRAAGVKITSIQHASTQARLYDRQGPGLASAAFLIDALAAALLAAGGALTTLASAARRRRFEYAALGVVGAGRRSLYAGLLIEQVAVLLFGAVAGAVAGIGASLLALRHVPEFVTAPTAVPLTYPVPAATLTVFLGAALVALLVLAAATSAALLAGASPDRLREIQE